MSIFPAPFEPVRQLTALADGRILASGRDDLDICLFALLDPTTGRWEGPLAFHGWLWLEQPAVLSPGQVLLTGDEPVVVTIAPFGVAQLVPERRDRFGIPVALSPDGVLVAGGFRDPSGPHTEVSILRGDRWLPCAPLPGLRTSGAGVRARSGRVVLCGEPEEVDERFTVDVYDPSSDTWTRTRPPWPAPELPAESLEKMREIVARNGHPSDPSSGPTTATWTSPVALADGTVLLFAETTGEFHRGLETMACLDPVTLAWSDPIALPEGVAQLDRPVGALPDGRFVTNGWSPSARTIRLWTWSRTDGWQESSAAPPDDAKHLAVLSDGRVAVVAEEGRTLAIVAV